MHPLSPRLFSIVFCFAALATNAQETATNRSHGLLFSLNAAHNEQTNLDRVLLLNGLPESGDFSAGFTIGRMFRLKQFELSGEATFLGNRRSRTGLAYQQAANLTAIQAKYLFGKNKTEWYPIVGIGLAATGHRLNEENSSRDINAALTTVRNTTTLYNRQGFAAIGFGFRQYAQPHGFFGLEVGYQQGFAATPWSTRSRGSHMVNSVTDELGQFYIKLTSGFYNKKRRQ